MAKLSETQIREIAELRENEGWSYDRLAKKFGVSAGAIHYQCLREGAVSPNTTGRVATGPMVMTGKDGRVQRRFTTDEDAQLMKLGAKGLSAGAIAKVMGRPNTSVRIRLMTLSLREEGYAHV